jgi:menaquinone-dependent protoporphyrinogen IX oxidase
MTPLIAFHSRTGYTRQVAETLAGECNAVVDEICPLLERTGVVGYLCCVLEARGGRAPAIMPARRDPREHELVIVGTPIWAWSLSSPVRSYLREHRGKLQRVAFFCTMGGAGADNAFSEMRDLCGKTPVATLALTDRQIDARSHDPALEAFVKALA